MEAAIIMLGVTVLKILWGVAVLTVGYNIFYILKT